MTTSRSSSRMPRNVLNSQDFVIFRRRRPWALWVLTAACLAQSGCQGRKAEAPETHTIEALHAREEEEAAAARALDLVPLVVVDGVAVLTRGDLEARVDALSARYESTPGRSSVSSSWRDDRRRYLLQTAVDEALIRTFLASYPPPPSNDETLATLRTANPNVFGNENIFERYLTSQAVSREDFLRAQSYEIALTRALEGRGLSEPTDEEMVEFYTLQRDQMRARERILLSSITIPLAADAPGDEVKRATQTLVEARRKIIEGTLTFADASNDHNVGSERVRHGDLGWIQRGEDRLLRVSNIEDTLFRTPIGEITEPLRTAAGLQIYWVRDHRAAGIRQLDEVREAILQPLVHRKRRQFRDALLEELRAAAVIEIDLSAVPFETDDDPQAPHDATTR